MKKSDWEDHELEELLQQLPKFRDTRKPNQIWQSIEQKRKPKQKSLGWVPAIAGVAALLLFTLLSYSIFENTANQSESSDKASEKANYTIEESKESKRELENSDEQTDMGIMTESDLPETTSLYSSQLAEDTSTWTLAIPDEQVQYLVPITYEVTGSPDDLEKVGVFLEVMEEADEAKLGLMEYFPLEADVAEGAEEGSIIIDFPKNSEYFNTDKIFIDVILRTMKYNNIQKVFFTTEGVKGAEFSHLGFLEELVIPKEEKRGFLLYQLDPESPQLFAPTVNELDTVEAALQEMKKNQEWETMSASIPDDFVWDTISEQNETLVISLAENTVLKDDKPYIQAVEAILLTAKDFGLKQVMFANANIDTIGEFDLRGKLDVPIGPNALKSGVGQ